MKYKQHHMTHIVDNGKDEEDTRNINEKLNNSGVQKKERSLFKTLTIMIIVVAVVVIASSLIEQFI
ncbi:MAG TPA: hypothetical protein VHH33_07675, partial [Nitrososphaeraceae archaeon]|nr:hypothetical protein [Nitrososphaeraceae archaeon]